MVTIHCHSFSYSHRQPDARRQFCRHAFLEPSLGLRGMESAGNLRLNVRLGSMRDRAPSHINHPSLLLGHLSSLHLTGDSPKTSGPFFSPLFRSQYSLDVPIKVVGDMRKKGKRGSCETTSTGRLNYSISKVSKSEACESSTILWLAR